MIDNFSFVNSNWIWEIVIIAILIWLVFAWKERDKYGSSKFNLHLFISFVAISSLVLIALQPQIYLKKDSHIAAIVTEGHDPIQLDSLKKANRKLEIYTYEIGETIIDNDKTPTSVFVLGNGIRAFDQWQLENIKTIFLGGKELKGVTQLNYIVDQTIGNNVQFHGNYKNPTKNNRLILEGPGGTTLDSLILTNEKSQLFKISTDLNVVGNFIFHLVEKDSFGIELSRDILPLTVVEKSSLNILILNSFPTFETKYLKNFLAEEGHQVVVKNQLTTARYKYEYFNMTSKPIIDIIQEKLEVFDLLIIDTKSLKGLSKQQRNILKNTVRELGLGVLIQPDANYFAGKKIVSSFKFDPEKSKEAVLNKYPKQNIKKYLYQFKDDFSIQPIHISDSKTWSAYERFGSGRFGSTVFYKTFELILNGHTKTYQYFWSDIIGNLSKQKKPSVQWKANDHFAYENQPFEFELRTSIQNPIVETNEGYSIPLQRDIHVKSLWKGKVYPREIGWKQHRVKQDSTVAFHYYVNDSSQWKSIANFNTIKSNQLFFKNTSRLENSSKEVLKLINPLWFFGIFILCSGYLWLEPKL